MVLNKRIIRELRGNRFRYGALFFLIVFSISIVVSMASATDSVFYTVDTNHKQNHVEDGEFAVFVPLSQDQVKEIENLGVKLEENFYVDLALEGSTLRIFKNRKYINTVELDQGALADSSDEIVLEKLYARSRGLGVGDTIVLEGKKYRVTGIGSVPDYSYVKENPYDVTADSDKFNIAFVAPEAFDDLAAGDAELELCYSYLLKPGTTDKKLKDHLVDIEFEESMVQNQYMKETIDEIESQKQQLKDGIDQLAAGSRKLTNGTAKLSDGANTLNNGLQDLAMEADATTNGMAGIYDGSYVLAEGAKEVNDGAFSLDKGIRQMRDKFLHFMEDELEVEYVNVSYFIPRPDNPRINDVKADSEINKVSALIAGIIILLLLAYVISVFIVHNIERESAVIGALYSLGYVKKDLLRHFMLLPLALVAAASITGTVIGYYMIPLMNEASALYSFPELQVVMKPYMLIYGIALPIIMALLVNFYVINQRLSLEPLKLLRKEKKQGRITHVDLGSMGFINRFRLRQFLREIRGNSIIVSGLFLAILLMVFAFGIKGSIDNYVQHTTDDTKFKYMYVLQYPEDKAPEEGAEAFNKSLYAYLASIDTDLEVNLLGIKADNPYFYFKVNANGDTNDVYISNSVAYKFGYKVGDKISLNDHVEDKSYTFHVAGIVPYSNGLYIFTNLKNMCKVFDTEDDYYNTVISDRRLNLEQGRIGSIIYLDDLAAAAAKFNEMMVSLVFTLLIGSIIIFILVLYLLLKMMVDKATFSISLVKVFGFNDQELKKMYLGSTFYLVLFATAVGIPISKHIVDTIWPFMISNVNAGFETYIPASFYLTIVGIILASYLVVNFAVGRHLKQVALVEILKDRE